MCMACISCCSVQHLNTLLSACLVEYVFELSVQERCVLMCILVVLHVSVVVDANVFVSSNA